MAQARTTTLILVAALACAAPLADASQPVDAGSVQVTERRVGSLYLLAGRFTVAASPAAAWSVLTDYNNLSSIVSSVRISHLLKRRGEEALVEQELQARVLFISKEVHLRLVVRERAPTEIDFRDVGGRDFEGYAGSWKISTAGDLTQVEYQLQARPRSRAPGNLMGDEFRKSSEALLEQLSAEMLRRNHSLQPRTQP